MVGFGVYIYIYSINALNGVYTTHIKHRIAVKVEDKYVIQNYI